MRRPLCSILALAFAFSLLASVAEARRGGGYRGGHAGGYRGHYGGRGYGWGGVALGLGVGAALAYRNWGWWGDYPGYAYGYSAWPYAGGYYGPAYQPAPMAPPAQQPTYVSKPAQSQEPVGMCRTNTLNVSCRLPQPLAPGAGCGCPSNMGMLPGQAAP